EVNEARPDVLHLLKSSQDVVRFFSPLSSKTTSDCSSASNSLDNKENVVVSTKRTNSDLEITDEEATTSKRSCPSSSPSPVGGLESELQSPQRQQEEGDRRIAQLLQKELDHEEKLRNTDRRKGSADAYQLRDKGGKETRLPRVVAALDSCDSN
ncbi:unnamed protein product, partial [Pleuronectes platessa]